MILTNTGLDAGTYDEIFNSDSSYYDGSNTGNSKALTEAVTWMDQSHSINLTLPPLGGIVLKISTPPPAKKINNNS